MKMSYLCSVNKKQTKTKTTMRFSKPLSQVGGHKKQSNLIDRMVVVCNKDKG